MVLILLLLSVVLQFKFITDYLRKIVMQGKSVTSTTTRVGDIMTDEVRHIFHSQQFSLLSIKMCYLSPFLLYFCFGGWQNKLITVNSDTNIVEAMQLMTGNI